MTLPGIWCSYKTTFISDIAMLLREVTFLNLLLIPVASCKKKSKYSGTRCVCNYHREGREGATSKNVWTFWNAVRYSEYKAEIVSLCNFGHSVIFLLTLWRKRVRTFSTPCHPYRGFFFFEGTLKAHKCNDCPWSLRKGTKARVSGPQLEGSICLCRMRSKALGMLKLTQDRGVKVREVLCRLSMDA